MERIINFFRDIPWGALGENTWDFTGALIAWIIITIGFFGTFLPIIPGPLIILGGIAVHRLWLGPEDSVSWMVFGILALIVALTYIVEYLSGALGAKWYGSSAWGVWGAILGGIFGIFFGLPGILLGPLVGAFAFEIVFAQQRLGEATKSTWGTVVGIFLGLVLKGSLSALMIVGMIADIYYW